MNIVNSIKLLFARLRGLAPSRLPTGADAFDAWANSIISSYPMPTPNSDSIKFVLATAIMHLGPTAAYKSKFYFVLLLNASAAKQVAGAKFQEIKLADQKRIADEAAAAANVAQV